MRLWILGLGALVYGIAMLAAGEAAAQKGKARGYKCPALGALNCMPSKKGRRAQCNPAYQSWARRNCPGFRIVR
jgi:hypothetical protein